MRERRCALLLALLLPACHRTQDQQSGPRPRQLRDAVPATDQLAPGELAEGTDKAFTLLLPRGLRIQQAVMGTIVALGPVPADDLANYILSHVRDGTVTRGANGTVFDGVRTPNEPNRLLHIRVVRLPVAQVSQLEVRDITPAALPTPSAVPTTDAERFRQAGLTPQGRFLDPQHSQ
jgi:hypothetical protein